MLFVSFPLFYGVNFIFCTNIQQTRFWALYSSAWDTYARVRPSVMQWVLAVRETVVKKLSRLNIVAQGLTPCSLP